MKKARLALAVGAQPSLYIMAPQGSCMRGAMCTEQGTANVQQRRAPACVTLLSGIRATGMSHMILRCSGA